MDSWKPSQKDQKQYPHFDAPLSLRELGRIANNPDRVARNPFFPFLRYYDAYRPFRLTGRDVKSREIRFGARRDAAIFSRYRHDLSQRYERLISKIGISECVLAYRHIPAKPGSSSGRCNIHHAFDAFDRIENFDECCAIVLDISKYFESIDHARLENIWCRLLGVASLPPDHLAVFKAITQYSVVDYRKAYEALGYFGIKSSGIPGYLVTRKNMPKQLCSMQDFKKKICGKAGGYQNLIEKNKSNFGIPQGAPLSDLLANAYLIDFDVEMKRYANTQGGFYMRYSDDILFIVPGGAIQGEDIMRHVRTRISAYGDQLNIKETKCFIEKFKWATDGMEPRHVYPTDKRSNGLSFLGFRFDGKRVYLRDQTLSNFQRNIARAVKREVYGLVKRFPGKNLAFLKNQLNSDKIIEKFGRVREFEPKGDKRDWTFWTYVKRAHKVFGIKSKIYGQVSEYRNDIRKRAELSLLEAFVKFNEN